MQALVRAIHARLISEPADNLPGISLYRGMPAVFSDERVPPDAILPYVHIRPNIAVEPFKTLRRDGERITLELAVYAEDNTGALLRDLAHAIKRRLDNAPLDVEGYDCAMTRATGPVGADDEQGYAGRIITLTAWLKAL